jgi:hypothetical protein
MDRDTKIGLVLALAFVGLVGAVLYHKMENPGTLHAVTPPTLVAQGTPPQTPPQDQPPVGDTPVKSTSEEPPPPAPPATPTPPTENKEGQGRIVINTGQPPRQGNSWWPWKKSDQAAIAKNDTPLSMQEPPPPGPPTAPSRQETPMHFPPAQPNEPVAKKEGGWFHFLHREKKKELAKPAGLTFDQPASSPLPPTKPPEQPTVKDVVLTTPSSQGNNFQPPSGPPEPTPPVAILPEKKSDTPLPPMVPEKKNEGPLFPPQAPSEPTITTLPVVKNEPPTPPVNPEPPVVRNDPPPPAPVNMEQPKPPIDTQVTRQKEIKTETVKPLPSSNTFDQRFPSSGRLGQPQDDNTSSNQPPKKADAGNSGQLVIIREQKDLPPAREGIPVVTRPGAIITKEYPRPQVQVTATEIRSYTPKQGETYATISRLFYGHEKYEAALAQFNKERNARLASVWPGEPIKYPSDKEYLERKYPTLINATAPRSPLDASGPTSRYVQPTDIQAVEARVSQPPPKPSVAPTKVGGAVPSSSTGRASTPRYLVRPNDSLYSIAQKTMGKGDRWNEIYALNKEVLRDPNQPEVGLLLKLPADAKVDTATTPE